MLCGKRKPLALARCTHVQYSVLVQVGVHNTVSSFLEMHGFVIISRKSHCSFVVLQIWEPGERCK